jgi:hypothetical protein
MRIDHPPEEEDYVYHQEAELRSFVLNQPSSKFRSCNGSKSCDALQWLAASATIEGTPEPIRM